MKKIILLAAIVVALPTLAQVGPGPGTSGTGNPIFAKREDPNRDANGNITSTTFSSFKYEVRWYLKPTDERKEVKPKVVCSNDCKRKVHRNHQACDFSCDKKCSRNHRVSMHGEYAADFAGQRQAMQDSRTLAAAHGVMNTQVDWSSESSNALQEIAADAKRYQTFNVAHFCKDPCSSIERTYGLRKYDVMIEGTLSQESFTRAAGKNSPTTSAVLGTHTNKVATAWYPDEAPISEGKPVVKCLCKTEPPKVDFFGATSDDKVTGFSLTSLMIYFGERKEACIIYIAPGTIFISTNGKAQRMMVVDDVQQSFPGTVLSPVLAPTMEKKVRAACIDRGLDEPGPGDVFAMSDAQDEELERAAGIIAKSRFRGPWDQALVWILTDAPTLDEVNKKMFPPVTNQRWADELRLAFEDCGAERTEKRSKLLKPSALQPLMAEASPAGFQFICQQLAIQANAKDDMDALATLMAGLKAHLATDPASCAWGLAWLCGHPRPEVAAVGLTMLAEMTDRSKLADAVAAARAQLFSFDPHVRGMAVGLVGAGDEVKAALAGMAKDDPDETVREKAKAALGG